MTQASIFLHLLFLTINLPDIVMLLLGGGCAFVLAYLITFAVGAFCRKVGWLDRPAARRAAPGQRAVRFQGRCRPARRL